MAMRKFEAAYRMRIREVSSNELSAKKCQCGQRGHEIKYRQCVICSAPRCADCHVTKITKRSEEKEASGQEHGDDLGLALPLSGH